MKIETEVMASYEEIAQEMGLTKSAVRKIEHRALRKLRKALEERGMTFSDLLPSEEQFTREEIAQ